MAQATIAAISGLIPTMLMTWVRSAAAFAIIKTETLAKTVDQPDQQYRCCGCNPGKCPDTQRMVFASRTGSRDIVLDRYSCIAV